MKNWIVALLMLCAVASFGQSGEGKENPGSLYSNGSENPYLDRVARKVGDILMIEIVESSSATFTAATNTSKSDGATASVDILKGFFNRLFAPLSTNGSGSSAGSGDTSYKSKMTTEMSAVVKKVMDNGMLVIEGTRTLVTNKETQTYVLSGIVRQQDISSMNTVPSNRIAEAEIKLMAKGAVGDRQRRGILTQLVDWLF